VQLRIDLSYWQRLAILIALLVIGLAGLLFMDAFPQDLDYHELADSRLFLGIPNFNNVVSNAGFALVGVLGLVAVTGVRRHTLFVIPVDAWPYRVFFSGVVLVSLGSAWYHWAPSNESLLWDRLAMSVAFMAFASAIVADRIHARAGNTWLLVVLIILGLLSLLYWQYTEQQGRGDLRFYAFVQFYPVILLPAVLWLFPRYRYMPGRYIAWVFSWYGLSKLLEHFDARIFEMLGYSISGQTLKHLAAAISAFVVLRMLMSRHRIRNRQPGRENSIT
jgi:hypothetical protein